MLKLLEGRTFTVFFQRLLMLISRAVISDMVCGISKTTKIPLNHANDISTVFAWTHRSVDLVAASIFLVLFNVCCSLLDQI